MPPSALVADGARRRALTRDDVIEKIRRWDALFGEPPTTADWNPSLARWRAQEWRIERYQAGDPETGAPWPSLNSAKRVFGGSFDAAVRAAGLVPHRPGPRRRMGVGGPAIAQREQPLVPREVDRELLAATERVLDAERRATRATARAERAEAQVAAVRERVRAAAERARERREAKATTATRAQRAAEARAEALAARLAAAEDPLARERERVEVAPGPEPAPDAERIAELTERLAAERRLAAVRGERLAETDRDLRAARAELVACREAAAAPAPARPEDRLAPAELARLRAATGPVGPGPLAEAVRGLAIARASGDPLALRRALHAVATAAVRWGERL